MSYVGQLVLIRNGMMGLVTMTFLLKINDKSHQRHDWPASARTHSVLYLVDDTLTIDPTAFPKKTARALQKPAAT